MDDLPVNPFYVNSVNSTGVKELSKSKWINGLAIETNDISKITAIKSLPFVLNVTKIVENTSEFIFIKNKAESVTPSENYNKRAINYGYGASYNQIHMLSGESLHKSGYSGEGILIAVFDAGFYKVNTLDAFDSIRKNNQILGTWDFVEGNTSVYEDDQHGMYALSAIAANLPGQLVGTAPKASFWLLRTEDANTESIMEEYSWAVGAEFADSIGADIISSSLGYNTFDDPAQNHTFSDMNGDKTPVTIAADKAASKGMLVVVSAGNEGGNSWNRIIVPADGDSVLAVGAVDANEVRAGFSSVGPSFDKRIKPNVVAQGVGVVLASAAGGTLLGNGTSFSCPIISGMAACLWQANPQKTNMEIFTAIEKSSSRYNTPDSLVGYGIPNFNLANNTVSSDSQTYISPNLIFSPNPFYKDLNLKYYSPENGSIVAEVFDAVGKSLLTLQKEITGAIVNSIYFNELDQFNSGVYLIKLSTPDKSFFTKVVKF